MTLPLATLSAVLHATIGEEPFKIYALDSSVANIRSAASVAATTCKQMGKARFTASRHTSGLSGNNPHHELGWAVHAGPGVPLAEPLSCAAAQRPLGHR